MKEPVKPWPPHKWEYERETTEQSLFYKEYVTDEDYDTEDYLENWKDQNDWNEGDPLPTFEGCSYHNEVCTLAELLAKVPPDVPHEDIVITMSRDRMYTYIGVGLTAKRPTDKKALKNSYKQAYQEYELKEKQYQKDLAEYQEWKKQDEIRQLEEKLAKLKK
jgi:hypothetical protein